ncbi:MAG: HTH domain-containing protein [Candidatus ainarchaeum sp.]|nr:HTH domain-containing protein [Candidatus ainarchaeum sp.]
MNKKRNKTKSTFASSNITNKMRLVGLVNSNNFSTLNQLAKHLGVSRTTVVKHLIELNSSGQLSDKNYFLQRIINNKLKRTRPILARKMLVKKQRIIDFINNCRRKKIPLSVNLLQQKFGGEKIFSKRILDIEEKKWANSSRPIIRRTKSDQPKRKFLKK